MTVPMRVVTVAGRVLGILALARPPGAMGVVVQDGRRRKLMLNLGRVRRPDGSREPVLRPCRGQEQWAETFLRNVVPFTPFNEELAEAAVAQAVELQRPRERPDAARDLGLMEGEPCP